jgi:hypothetical protein
MKKTFLTMVMNHFQYLIADYGFLVTKAEESEHNLEIEGRIEFESPVTFVTVSAEQLGVNVSVGRVKDDKYYYFLDPRSIYEYLSLSEADKWLVCSFDPKDDRRARMVISQIRLLHESKDTNDIEEDIDEQLSNYSKWLRQYAEPFLRGDFSRWLEIYQFMVTRQRAAHIRSGREEFVRTVQPDKRVSIFQNKLDYLRKLRDEYGNE